MTNPDTPTPPADDIAARLENGMCLFSKLDWQEQYALAREAATALRQREAELRQRDATIAELRTRNEFAEILLEQRDKTILRLEGQIGRERRAETTPADDDELAQALNWAREKLVAHAEQGGNEYTMGFESIVSALEKVVRLNAAIAELRREKGKQCEWCGAKVSSYPMGCPGCGAPQCCQPCCDKANAEARVQELEAELHDWRNGDLRGVQAHMDAAEARATDLQRRLDEALGALRPFAEAWGAAIAEIQEGEALHDLWRIAKTHVDAEHFRAAHAVIQKEGE